MSFSVVLINPLYPHNVGQTLRAAACFGVSEVFMSGNRVSLDTKGPQRLPREERMRGTYGSVQRSQRPFDATKPLVPVAVELPEREGSFENLITFEHPENAVYVFGPEDGGLDRAALGSCHRFVSVPAAHCLNLASAVAVLLYDRHAKRVGAGLEEPLRLERLTEVVGG